MWAYSTAGCRTDERLSCNIQSFICQSLNFTVYANVRVQNVYGDYISGTGDRDSRWCDALETMRHGSSLATVWFRRSVVRDQTATELKNTGIHAWASRVIYDCYRDRPPKNRNVLRKPECVVTLRICLKNKTSKFCTGQNLQRCSRKFRTLPEIQEGFQRTIPTKTPLVFVQEWLGQMFPKSSVHRVKDHGHGSITRVNLGHYHNDPPSALPLMGTSHSLHKDCQHFTNIM